MKKKDQLLESIDRFRQGFWEKKNIDRPPIGIAPQDIFTPIKYLYSGFTDYLMKPSDLEDQIVLNDYDYAFAKKTVTSDDFLSFSAPWRAIPWLECICGCTVKYSTGSLAAGECIRSLRELADLTVPVNREWLDCLGKQIHHLTSKAADDCWVSPTILRGPSDVLAAMRGLSDFYCDLIDDTSTIDNAAGKINDLFINILDMHFSMTPPKFGGYGHIYGYWAPDKTIVIQEDVMGMCSPRIYREIFYKYNMQIVKHLGSYVLFHLHSTGYQHYRDVLNIENIAGIQFTVESNGPELMELVPFFKVNFRIF